MITLVGNKCDLPNREVQTDEAMEFAKKNGFNYMEVSAKTGKNIKVAFSSMVSEVHNSYKIGNFKAMTTSISRVDG